MGGAMVPEALLEKLEPMIHIRLKQVSMHGKLV